MHPAHDELKSILCRVEGTKVIPHDLNLENPIVLDFTRDNPELQDLDVADVRAFSSYISQRLEQAGTRVGIGKYDENRTIYDKSAVFSPSSNHDQRRTLHLGLDLWVAPGTPVLAALDGVVHSFQDNNAFGDYGPTIILEHLLEGVTFYTLYGHLNRKSLTILEKGQVIQTGRQIAMVGDVHENGGWPAHLHFEIIRDLGGMAGDFPGVCALRDRERYVHLCPDPNLLLRIRALENE